MSRMWEALHKVDTGALRRWADEDRNSAPGEAAIKPAQKIAQVARECDLPPNAISEATGVPYSAFKSVQAVRTDDVVFHTSPNSPASDRFRLLRMRLRTLSSTGKLRSILVTSPLPEDGKTTVSLNLATALAEQGKRKVLLIDADLHRGSIAEKLQLKPEIGLKECLHDGLNPINAIRAVEPFGWHLLQAGTLRLPNLTDLLRPQDLSDLLQKVAAHFDWIVLDSPPVLVLSDSVALSQAVDGSLLVARADRTPSKAVEDALALLGRKNVVGLVLNGVSSSAASYSAYRKYHQPDNAATDEATAG